MSHPEIGLSLTLRRWAAALDDGGHAIWREVITPEVVPSVDTAIVICDMWDAHWSRGASERVDAMVARMNAVVAAVRAKGVHIIHAPSDTLDFYAGTPARRRALEAPVVIPPPELMHDDPPLPIDDSDEGSDTGEPAPFRAWSRQHAALAIDHDLDAISDNGSEVYSLLRMWNVRQVLL
ncbi:MAG: protein-signal peptide and transmembrane prediction, partial [Anaerolineae bacterium]|nr:protein-signal peptide and transmembrane prediction [Anaerolineae bacterium]